MGQWGCYGAEADASRKTLLSVPEYKVTTDCSSTIRDSLQEFSRWLTRGVHQICKQAAYKKNVNNSAFLPTLTTMETITTISLLTYFAVQPCLSCAYRHRTGYRSSKFTALPDREKCNASHSLLVYKHNDNTEIYWSSRSPQEGQSWSATQA